MKTGIELIAIERAEQIEKHGHSVIRDVAENSTPSGPFKILPLRIGITKCIGTVSGLPWPEHWDENVCAKIEGKSDLQKLIVAGAMIAAEIDRIQKIYIDTILELAEISKEGYAGILPSGMIVDRRKFPNAQPIPENESLGVGKPKEINL
jgi:hypothetical protein